MLYNELAISIFGEEVLIGNCRSKTLLRVNDEDLSGVEHNQVLDLSDDGDRWEGDVLNNEPYGWGVLYDSENRMVYEGFRLKDVNVCSAEATIRTFRGWSTRVDYAMGAAGEKARSMTAMALLFMRDSGRTMNTNSRRA